jgi:hypothetical protein
LRTLPENNIMVFSKLNPFSTKKIRKILDINGDGAIGLDDVKAVFSGEKREVQQELTAKEFVEQRAKAAWSKLEPRFVLLSVAVQKRERTSRHWVRSKLPFGQDRKVNSIIEDLTKQFEDQELAMFRTEYAAQVLKVKDLENQLADVKATMAMQDASAIGKYERTAEKLTASIEKETNRRATTLHSFRVRMQSYGVELCDEEAEVLMSRIDAGDVTRMATIFVVISAITRQFESAKKESGENLGVTKKYYGIYIGLLELQMQIQSTYLSKVDEQYLPGVARIAEEAKGLVAETQLKIKKHKDEHKGQYRQNISAQEFTINVTKIYSTALRADREKVAQARVLIEKLHDLAQNTLSTVRVSADLSSLIQQAEGMYQEVMSLHTPVIVPFENLQLKKEFEAVTSRLKNRG